jgi:hypothetical protein
MNKTIVGLIIGILLGAAGTWFAMSSHASGPEPKTEAARAEKPRENPLHLPPARREAAGIKLAAVRVTQVAPQITAYGRVLDATSLATLGAELATTRAALAASEKELERVKKLFAAGANASAQAVETATATVARDRAAVASAQTRLVAGWGRDVATHYDDIASALEHGASLARLDVLAGDKPVARSGTIALSLAGSDETFQGQIRGVSPVTDPQATGTSLLVLVPDHPLPSGAALQATLPAEGVATDALVVPRSAVVYHEGSAWVYVLGEEDTFERKLVAPGHASAGGVTVTTGLEAGDQVVAGGAQQLLSAELQAGGGIPED